MYKAARKPAENFPRRLHSTFPSESSPLTAFVFFMSTPERVFSRLDLLERLKGDSLEGVERTIDVHIRNLRAKIEPDPAHPQYILTVFGIGYRFITDRELAAT